MRGFWGLKRGFGGVFEGFWEELGGFGVNGSLGKNWEWVGGFRGLEDGVGGLYRFAVLWKGLGFFGGRWEEVR